MRITDLYIFGKSGEAKANAAGELGMKRRDPAVEHVYGDALAGRRMPVRAIERQIALIDSIERQGQRVRGIDRGPGATGRESVYARLDVSRSMRARLARRRNARASSECQQPRTLAVGENPAQLPVEPRTHETAACVIPAPCTSRSNIKEIGVPRGQHQGENRFGASVVRSMLIEIPWQGMG